MTTDGYRAAVPTSFDTLSAIARHYCVQDTYEERMLNGIFDVFCRVEKTLKDMRFTMWGWNASVKAATAFKMSFMETAENWAVLEDRFFYHISIMFNG